MNQNLMEQFWSPWHALAHTFPVEDAIPSDLVQGLDILALYKCTTSAKLMEGLLPAVAAVLGLQ